MSPAYHCLSVVAHEDLDVQFAFLSNGQPYTPVAPRFMLDGVDVGTVTVENNIVHVHVDSVHITSSVERYALMLGAHSYVYGPVEVVEIWDRVT